MGEELTTVDRGAKTGAPTTVVYRNPSSCPAIHHHWKIRTNNPPYFLWPEHWKQYRKVVTIHKGCERWRWSKGNKTTVDGQHGQQAETAPKAVKGTQKHEPQTKIGNNNQTLKEQDRKDTVRDDGGKRKRNGGSVTNPKQTIDNKGNRNRVPDNKERTIKQAN
jgi:hypothetical protein